MNANTGPLRFGADGPAVAGQAAPVIPYQAYVLAAGYLAAGKGPADVRALARLFGALPHMERDILAAMADLAGR